MAVESCITLSAGQYELTLNKLRLAASELEEILNTSGLTAADQLRVLRLLGEVECLRAVLESRRNSESAANRERSA